MIQRTQLRTYLLVWIAFGLACSAVMVCVPSVDRGGSVLRLAKLWALLPLSYVIGLEGAMGIVPRLDLKLFAALTAMAWHAWLSLTTRSLDWWLALHCLHLIATAAGVWGFYQLIRHVSE